ncbi:MAG TPA: hypothetical protein VK694_02030 [Verrucomicrobiae bacterium]|nr:hypothetical protein [Verrucomicrobiae bacterium]
MSNKTNVVVLVPDTTVASMTDEVADNSVQKAADAAVAAYTPFDSDSNVPVITYGTDLAGALEVAKRNAASTDGNDLSIVISDGNTADRASVEAAVANLDGDKIVIVVVNNQPDGEVANWLRQLDDDGPAADDVDVLDVNSLPGDEVPVWFAS